MSDNTVGRIHQRQAQAEGAEQEQGASKVIGMDAYSITKQHTYATIIPDLINRRVVETFERRDQETVTRHREQLPHKEVREAVVIAMSGSFRSAVQEAWPGRAIVADKFHVIARGMKAVDDVRKRVQHAKPKGEKGAIFRLRYRLRTGREKRKAEEAAAWEAFRDQEPELRAAYQLQEAFRDLDSLPNREAAEPQLQAWCDQAWASGLPEMAQGVETLGDWWTESLNYFTWRDPNGFTEGKNHRMKVLKRRGYGYRHFDNFRLHMLAMVA